MILSNPYANGFREAEWNPLHAVVTGACKTELPLHRVGIAPRLGRELQSRGRCASNCSLPQNP